MLIRHGETDYVKTGRMAGRTPGVHLNEKGRREALELAECLKNAPLQAIYSSPMERAIETAQPLARMKRLKIIKSGGLIETDIGDWKGMEIKKARKLDVWKIVQATPSRFRFPSGESFLEAQTRQVSAVEEIVARHPGSAVIAAFSHADPIKLVMAYYLGIPLDNFQRLACQPGSVSLLTFSKHGVTALGLNLRPPFQLHPSK